jgi:hypothetical protein
MSAKPADISDAIWEAAELLMDEFRSEPDDLVFVARILAADRSRRRMLPTVGGLTQHQKSALDFIRGFVFEHGFSPSYGEIAQALGLAGKSQVHKTVHELADRGAIALLPNRARSIQVVGGGH